ncbi:MAG TPA: tetratricopeptide repeat-containing protein [Ilumatobacteraceae bacterium]
MITDGRVLRVETLMARGEYLAAYDLADEAEKSTSLTDGDRVRIWYLRALALARTGATERAGEEVERLIAAGAAVDDLDEDVWALKARVAKDIALAQSGEERDAAAAVAAADYEAVYRRFGRPYACVNAATLWQVSGDAGRAKELAGQALDLARADALGATSDIDRYWAAATEAEAALVVGDVAAATASLARAGSFAADNYAARATTRKQLIVLMDAMGLGEEDLLLPIANPEVVHYCGHLIAPSQTPARFLADDEDRVRGEIDRWLQGREVGDAYGSLAAGADILAAEGLLAHGAELHVVLPFAAEEFVRVSVRDAGPAWRDRFQRCLDAASSVTVTCDSAYLGDDDLFGFAARVAMGQAVNRSVRLASTVRQLAVWDGASTGLTAGTAHDVAVWKAAGFETDVIRVAGTPAAVDGPAPSTLRRPVLGLVFGDFRGFSALRDEETFPFVQHVLAPIAATIDSFGDAVVMRNTWGDGLFLTLTTASAAAEVSLAIQETLDTIDYASHGLPEMRMRLAAHVGPVITIEDPVRHQLGVFGRELVRAARIEPRTPPGEVYATHVFAAVLALETDAPASPQYVGILTTAKDFETTPIYVLKPRTSKRSAR